MISKGIPPILIRTNLIKKRIMLKGERLKLVFFCGPLGIAFKRSGQKVICSRILKDLFALHKGGNLIDLNL